MDSMAGRESMRVWEKRARGRAREGNQTKWGGVMGVNREGKWRQREGGEGEEMQPANVRLLSTSPVCIFAS